MMKCSAVATVATSPELPPQDSPAISYLQYRDLCFTVLFLCPVANSPAVKLFIYDRHLWACEPVSVEEDPLFLLHVASPQPLSARATVRERTGKTITITPRFIILLYFSLCRYVSYRVELLQRIDLYFTKIKFQISQLIKPLLLRRSWVVGPIKGKYVFGHEILFGFDFLTDR